MERSPPCTGCSLPLRVECRRFLEEGEEVFHCCGQCPYYQSLTAPPTISRLSSEARCPQCKLSLQKIQAEGAIGCMTCLQQFESDVEAFLIAQGLLSQEMRRSSVYLGPPQGSTAPSTRSSHRLSLEVALKQALHHERYEEAAALRDQLRRLEGGI